MDREKRITLIQKYIQRHNVPPEIIDYAIIACIPCESPKDIFHQIKIVKISRFVKEYHTKYS